MWYTVFRTLIEDYMRLEELKKYARLKGNKIYINRNGRYITQFIDEKEAARFAKLAIQHKSEFIDKKQFLSLLVEKYKGGLDSGI